MILVTGATGNVGSEAARLLAARRQPTRALVRDPARAPHGHIEIATGDFDRPDTLDAAMRGIEATPMTNWTAGSGCAVCRGPCRGAGRS
jgi:uncharacterized protein YbjT (DUF2867 family)